MMMNIALWILQILLAVAFAAHGILFLAPPAEMVAQMNESIPPALRLFIGVAEVLAAIEKRVRQLPRRFSLPWPQLSPTCAGKYSRF
jgi:DoxX-like family